MSTLVKTRRFGKMILIDSPWIDYNYALLGLLICMMPRRAFTYNVSFEGRSGKSPLEKISKSFLDDPQLRFTDALPAETIETVFRKHNGLFGGRFYNTVFVLWAFVLQTLSGGKSRSCSTAVGRIAAFSHATGESALLRKMLDSFDPDDVAVFDRYCCSYMMFALFQQRGVHVCTRINAKRIVDFRRGKRLDEYDRLVVWKRPARPEWMSKEVFETMELRMIQYSLVCRGRRSKTITVVTTLTDPVEYPKEEIAELYGHRWNVELDIRQIKQTLNMDHFRCKSPEMVEREFWVTLLGYNLVRKTMCEAASFAGVLPRRLSFTRTAAHLLDLRLCLMIGTKNLWRDF